MLVSNQDTKTIKSEYDELEPEREVFLSAARTASKYSIQTYYPESSSKPYSNLEQPQQSFVAKGLQNLVSKSLTALLSLEDQTAFFKFQPNANVLQSAIDKGESKDLIEEGLAGAERAIVQEMIKDGVGELVSQALFHVFIAGNYLLYIPTDAKIKIRGFALNKYVILRDCEGNPLKIITKETLRRETLPDYAKLFLEEDDENGSCNVDLYTKCVLIDGKWEISQEINNQIIPETIGLYDNCPFIPLTFTRINDNNYGTGLIELYIGDIKRMTNLEKNLEDATTESSRIVWQISRSAHLTEDEFNNLRNGGAIIVNQMDQEIKPLTVNKMGDLQVVRATIDSIKSSLSPVFLLYEQRQAERVSAEEVRITKEQFEQSHSALYAHMNPELQLPLVKNYIIRSKNGNIKALAKVNEYHLLDEPIIITGLKALGRVNELQKLSTFAQVAAQTFKQSGLSAINQASFLRRIATSLSISDYGDLIKTDDQLQQEAQQAQQAQLLKTIAPNAVTQIGKSLTQEEKQQQTSE